jgi:hypothetical protein
MKKWLQFSILIILVILASCKKEEYVPEIVTQSPQPPISRGKTVKVKVLEYGTDLPVGGAEVSLWASSFSSPFNGDYTRVITNNNGEGFFSATSYVIDEVIKHGYYENLSNSCLVRYFGPDSLKDFHSGDSVIVRVVPGIYITLNVKNIYDNGPRLASLMRQGSFTDCPYYPQHIIPLRPRIDTSFQLAVYGNSENIFTVGNQYGIDGVPGANLYQNTVYIPKTNGYYLNIEY